MRDLETYLRTAHQGCVRNHGAAILAAAAEALDWQAIQAPIERAHGTVLDAVAALETHGVAVAVDPFSPAGAVLIAEAVNWAAKVIDPGFYSLKPPAVAAALAYPDVIGGYGEDGAFYLHARASGVASFHDPFGEIAEALAAYGIDPDTLRWEHPWSGVTRQELAFDLLVDARLRRRLAAWTDPRWCAVLATWATAGPARRLPG